MKAGPNPPIHTKVLLYSPPFFNRIYKCLMCINTRLLIDSISSYIPHYIGP